LYAWADVTSRFECPCHGSKFSLTGKYIAGPAPRSLDRFEIIATRPDGTEIITPPDGAGIQLNGDEELTIDTGKRIFLPGRVEV
jgi:Rieske Fe-S protein